MKPRRFRGTGPTGWGCLLAVLLPMGGASAQEAPLFVLDTLPVVGSRAGPGLQAPMGNVVLLDRGQIDRLPARTVPDLLRWVVGVDLLSRSPASADLSIRGSGFEEVLVLVDGVRVSDAQTGHFDLDLTIPMERLERVEILRGPASALHGSDAVGGVVNLVTRGPSRGGTLRAEGGSFGTTGLSANLEGGERLRGHFALEWNRSDGHRRGTDHDTRMVHAGGRLPAAGGEFRADVGVALRAFGAHRFYADNPDWDEFEETRTTTLAVAWRQDPARRTRWELRGSFRRHGDTFLLFRSDPSFYRNRHTGHQVEGEVTARSSVGGVAWAAGAVVGADLLNSNNLGTRQEARGASFGEAIWQAPWGLSAQVGVRADLHERWGTTLSPTLALSRSLGHGLQARTSVGRAFRGPTFTERFYEDPANVGSPDLDPERSWSGEAGLDWTRDAGPGRVSVTGWLRESSDLIDWARPLQETTGPWRTRNVDRASFRGLEVEGAGEFLPALGWTAGLSLLRLEAREQDGLRSKSTLRPTVRSVRGALHHQAGPLDIGVQVGYAARRDEEGHARVDLRSSARPFPGWTLRLDLTNAGNASIPDVTGVPGPRRALVLGVERRSPGLLR